MTPLFYYLQYFQSFQSRKLCSWYDIAYRNGQWLISKSTSHDFCHGKFPTCSLIRSVALRKWAWRNVDNIIRVWALQVKKGLTQQHTALSSIVIVLLKNDLHFMVHSNGGSSVQFWTLEVDIWGREIIWVIIYI